jgi:hypothetical protein
MDRGLLLFLSSSFWAPVGIQLQLLDRALYTDHMANDVDYNRSFSYHVHTFHIYEARPSDLGSDSRQE